MRDFPRTLRTIGPDANGAFRSYLLDYNVISLVHPHPNSDGYYPGTCKILGRWERMAERFISGSILMHNTVTAKK